MMTGPTLECMTSTNMVQPLEQSWIGRTLRTKVNVSLRK